jgi:flap endonuclease-1
MGIQIAEIIPRKEIEISDLKGKIIAVDAFNTLYQFLTTIRQADGTLLMDSKGRITSHLSGIFYRNINLLQEGIKIIYVFDGKPPELKLKEIQRRKEQKEIAKEKLEKAKESGDTEAMYKYSQQTVKITEEIIEESKKLLKAMGIPVIQAETEGEAEAALLTRNGESWASASQDYDSLLYATPRLIRNLTLSRKRKTSSGAFVETKIELVELEKVLNELQINLDQLICLGILVGTDYNPGGVRGIGQKRALEIVKKFEYPLKIFEFISKSEKYVLDFDWQPIFHQFKSFKENYKGKINFDNFNIEEIKKILIDEHQFSEERINSSLEKLRELEKSKKQKGLNEFW